GVSTATVEDVHAEDEAQNQRDHRAADSHAASAQHHPASTAAGLPTEVFEILAASARCPTHRRSLEHVNPLTVHEPSRPCKLVRRAYRTAAGCWLLVLAAG